MTVDLFARPMRWAQLTLVENDPGRYDPAFWLDYFRRIKADAACLSAGGCVAYYPTQIPYHHRSAWMGESDPFGELVEGCRRLGMLIMARTDPHSILDDAYEAHPEWAAVDAEGQPRRHWAAPHRWVTCAHGPYNFEFMTEVHREIMQMYGVAAIFSNRWAGSGTCYCEHCQRAFYDAYHLPLPRTRDPKDPSWRSYILWQQQNLFALWQRWDQVIQEVRPDARYVPNSGGGALSSLNMRIMGERSEILFADRQARRGLMAPWAAGKNAKEYRATLGTKPVGGIFSVGVEEHYRWKDSVQTSSEIEAWVADATAQGLRPWFTKFGGVLYDQRWLAPVEDIYRWQADIEPYLRNTANLATVAMVYSQQTAAYYGGEQAQQKVEDHSLGWYQALIEARIPFEMVHDELLDAEHVDRFKVLILPNIAALSEAQCQQLRGYVARGGSLIATHETSLYDAWGVRREHLGLADLFSCDVAGPVEGPLQNAYLNIDACSDGSYHRLLQGLEGVGRIIHGAQRLPTTPNVAGTPSPLTLVPSYPDLPMEEVYPRQEHTDVPEVYTRELGAARIVYFPWDIDRTFWEVLCVDHGRLLANAVRWALNEPLPVEIKGDGVLDVSLWRQANSLTLHLVNLTNPMLMKGPQRQVYPIGPLTVRLRLPEAVQVKQVHLLKAEQELPYQINDGMLSIRVSRIDQYEIVALDLV